VGRKGIERMSADTEGFAVKVNDRRRFDADGNLKPDAPEKELPADPVGPPATATTAEAQALRADLDATRKRLDEVARAYQAQVQEREEFKQRLTRERERLLDVEKAEVAQVLLDAVDELDLSLNAAGESPLARGVKIIRDGILAKLQAAGIQRIDVVGLPFDPNTAEASDMEITPDPAADQRVTAEVRAGYRLKDRVIRPARVRVAKHVAPARA
jgi:molecular chaperone GrpE